MTDKEQFLKHLKTAFQSNEFQKLTLGKKAVKSQDLQNIYIRPIIIKAQQFLSFTYRYATRDEVKNYTLIEANEFIDKLLGADLLSANLFTDTVNYELLYNKKRNAKLVSRKATQTAACNIGHDREKKRLITSDSVYLKELGVSDAQGSVKASMNDKYRQINKFIEIVENLVGEAGFDDSVKVLDMGAGKGYLTFAVYDYLKNTRKLNVSVKGVELRKKLVDFCNLTAQKSGFQNLSFAEGTIINFADEKPDILIALHACDTATDEALYKGITQNAKVIIVSPCCHKQVRKSMKPTEPNRSILKHGILLERQAELLTDGIRALLLEANGYDAKVFEFISNEHTGKNLMITAVKNDRNRNKEAVLQSIKSLKKLYGIEYQYLEKLLQNG